MKPFKLAQRLQEAFKNEPSVLTRSTGTNAIVFRAPNGAAWRGMLPDGCLRDELVRFSAERVERLARAMRPQLVVVIGFGTARLLGTEFQPLARRKGGRALLCSGTFAERDALVMRHPTPPACPPINAELAWIGSNILSRLQGGAVPNIDERPALPLRCL